MQHMMILAPFSPPQPLPSQFRLGSPASLAGPEGFHSLLMHALEGVQLPAAAYLPDSGGPGVSVPLGGPISLVSLLMGRSLEQTVTPAETEVGAPSAGSPGELPSAEGEVPAEALQGLIGWLTALTQGAQPQIPPQFLTGPLATIPLPMAQIEAALSGVAEDPLLEQFVQQVLQRLKGGSESSDLPKQTAQVSAGPTFSELVELIVAKAETLGTRPPDVRTGQAVQTGDGGSDLPELPEAPAMTNLAEQQAALLSDGDGTAHRDGFGLKSDSAVEGVDIRQRVVQAEQVMRQVTRTVRLMVNGGRSELRLQLHPEHLGTVTVKLVVTEGVVQATLNARDPGVRQVLQANLEQLRQRFVDQGMKVEHVEVAVGGDSPFSQFDHPHQREAWDDRRSQWHRRQAWQQQPEIQLPEPGPSLRSASGWYPGRTGARINSLA